MSEIKIPRLPSPYPFESYPYLVEPLSEEEGGGYLISLPDLPGCMSDGSTEAEALANARDAFATWISARLDLGKPIPAPTHHIDPKIDRVFRALHEANGTPRWSTMPTHDDYDSPWKEVLEHTLREFKALCFPDAHRQID